MDYLTMQQAYDAGYEAAKQHTRELNQRRREREVARRQQQLQRLKQKALGLVAVAAGIASVFIDYDATAAVIIVPLGLYMFFTKENVLSEGEQ